MGFSVADLTKLDRIKSSGVWVLLGILALPLSLNSMLSLLAQINVYEPAPITTEPRAEVPEDRAKFLEMYGSVRRHEELLGQLVQAQQDVSSAVKSNAITTGVVAQAIEKGFERLETELREHDRETRRR